VKAALISIFVTLLRQKVTPCHNHNVLRPPRTHSCCPVSTDPLPARSNRCGGVLPVCTLTVTFSCQESIHGTAAHWVRETIKPANQRRGPMTLEPFKTPTLRLCSKAVTLNHSYSAAPHPIGTLWVLSHLLIKTLGVKEVTSICRSISHN